jgi:hypothetical protein
MEMAGFADAWLLDALEGQGSARVLIAFSTPGSRGRLRAVRASNLRARQEINEAADRILAGFAPGEFQLRGRFRSLGAMAGSVDARGLARLFRDPEVLGVAHDVGVSGQLAESVPLARLDVLQGLGITGAGVTVAIVDSGLDTDHADLVDDLTAERCFCGAPCCPNGRSDQSGPGSAEDDNGHGTNVAGIVTSAGFVAPVGGAPDAAIVAVKVLDSDNRGFTSDVLLALEYILDERPDVDIVNMSLGTDQLYPGVCDDADFITQAYASLVAELRLSGVLPFAASMNNGSGTQMGAPACVSGVISVGAVYDADLGSQTRHGCTDPTTAPDQVPCWSNSNAATDLFAPGAMVTSSWLYGLAVPYAGTSQASPLAAACAALLVEADPTLSPEQVEIALTSSSTLVTDPKNGLSFPRLDCEESLGIVGAGACGDALDNDGDGLTDYPEDPGCDAADDASENSPDLPCDDGLDNDGDGFVDYPDDSDCRDVWDLSEEPECMDGLDNDSDGFVDFPADRGCQNMRMATESPQCNDGADNDLDGFTDYPEDPNCLYPWLGDESFVFYPVCGLGAEILLVLAPLLWFSRRKGRIRAGPRGRALVS